METVRLYGVFYALKMISLLAKWTVNQNGNTLFSMAILKPPFNHHLSVEKNSQLRANFDNRIPEAEKRTK
jgi:hypothetical protein